MKTKALSKLLTFLLCLPLLYTSAGATKGAELYIDANGNETGIPSGIVGIYGNVSALEDGKFYAYYSYSNQVEGSISVGTDVSLIIYDGCNLTLDSLTGTAGTLNIYAGAATGSSHLNVLSTGTCSIGSIDSGVTVTLYGGTFSALPSSGWKLGEGHTFRTGTSESDYQYSKTFTAGAVVVNCPHPDGISGGSCPACGNAALTHEETTTYYTDITQAIAAAKEGDTVKLLDFVYDDLTIEDAEKFTLDIGDYGVTKLTVKNKPISLIRSGKWNNSNNTLETSGGVTIGDLLGDGWGLYTAGGSKKIWYDSSTTKTTLESFHVAKLPIQSVTLQPDKSEYTYGDTVKLTATVTTLDNDRPTVLWYEGDDKETASEWTDKRGLTVCELALEAGTHTCWLKAELDDQIVWKSITIAVDKATPVTPAGLQGKKGNLLSSVDLPDDWSWVDGTQKMTATGSRTFYANYTAPNQNYESQTNVPVTVQVENKTQKALTVTMQSWYVDDVAATPQFTAPAGTTNTQILYLMVFENGGTGSPATTVPTAAGNYKVVVQCTTAEEIWYGEATFSIQKHQLIAPVFGTISESGKTLADVEVTLSTENPAGTTFAWTDGDDTAVERGKSYIWTLTPTDTETYETLSGTYIPWAAPVSGGSSGGSSNKTTTTAKNPDGSTTTTTTNKRTGTVTETTKNQDGSTTTIETKSDGTVTKTEKTATGTTSTTVTDSDGNTKTTVSISKKDAKGEETVTLPVDKEKPADKSGEAREITVEIPENTSVTVEIPVENPTPGTVVVLVDEKGNETIVSATKLTENGVEITLTESSTLKVVENSADFTDVTESDYFHDAVAWVSSRNITGGTGENHFSPDATCTRTELVTFLWRAAGSPTAKTANPFADVPADTYYTEAVSWALEQDIASGYDNGQFGSGDTITREQVAVMLYRYVQSQGGGFTGAWAYRMDFADIGEVSDWAWEAICWCNMKEILVGYDGNLMPKAECTRSQIVTMLYRLLAE